MTVLYTVADADVVCQWVVALNNSNEGTILDQNADASRYLIHTLSQDQAKALVLSRKKPVYPGIATLAHMGGDVSVRLTVSPSGVPEKADLISSPPMFQIAATNAAMGWTFKPLMIGTQAVRFQTIIKFIFVSDGPSSSHVTSTP